MKRTLLLLLFSMTVSLSIFSQDTLLVKTPAIKVYPHIQLNPLTKGKEYVFSEWQYNQLAKGLVRLTTLESAWRVCRNLNESDSKIITNLQDELIVLKSLSDSREKRIEGLESLYSISGDRLKLLQDHQNELQEALDKERGSKKVWQGITYVTVSAAIIFGIIAL